MSEDVEMREEREDRESREEQRETRDTLSGRLAERRGTGERDERREEIRDAMRDEARPDTEPTRESLFAADRATQLRSRWSDVQSRFVDDPRAAVKEADALVDEVIRDLSEQFSNERSSLEGQWGRDEKVSTEDLRVALRRYRSFFERLLSV